MTQVILALDQGTTNSKVLAVAADGQIVAKGSAKLPIYHPQDGWVEQRPEEIWQSTLSALRSCLASLGGAEILGMGISNQRESVLAWHAETGEALAPCISWQCRRTIQACQDLKAAGHERMVQEKTGLPLDPMFPATKIAWLLGYIADHHPALAKTKIRIGTVDSWLLWNLTAGEVFACDASNAARTQLYNVQEGQWDAALAALFGVDLEVLPAVKSSNAKFGVSKGVAPLPDGVPVHAMLGDSHAALFGHGITEAGVVKATYGTGSSLMTPVDAYVVPQKGVTTTIAWAIDGVPTYALEGNILVSAASLPWVSEVLGLEGDVAALSELAESAEALSGVYFVPAFVGLGAPYWDGKARAIFSGITFNTGREQLARAAFEGLAHQISDVFEAMSAQAPAPLQHLLADGGASANAFLMQLQADQLGVDVVASDVPEASALGAGLLAGMALGIWADAKDVPALAGKRAPVRPQLDAEKRKETRSGWHDAVARARL